MGIQTTDQKAEGSKEMTMLKTNTLKVPGATIYYEVTGSGPVLLCIPGGPTDAGMFAEFQENLSDRYTVVAYDPRGHSRSTVDGAPEDIPVSVHADDAAALLQAVTDEPAFVFGSSGGGTIGLELVTRHPELVKTFVSHEAPVMELLPDASHWRDTFADIYETYKTEGVFPAMGKFGAAAEEGEGGPKYSEEMAQQEPTPQQQEMGARMGANFETFMAHEIRQIGGYVPDIEKLKKISTRIVSVAGETSGQQAARRAAIALAERLGIPSTPMPGAHGGWGSDLRVFADRLDEILRG
jgi:pimeloyl-ACP methyl ester carboxylesterase